MTRVEFIAYLVWQGRLSVDRRWLHDPLLMVIITTMPLGYSLYEARVENHWRLGGEVPTDA